MLQQGNTIFYRTFYHNILLHNIKTGGKIVDRYRSVLVIIVFGNMEGDILNRYKYSVFSQEELREQRKKMVYDIGDKVMTFFNDEGSTKHGFEKRKGQQDIALEILDAILKKEHIAVEAETALENHLHTWSLYCYIIKEQGNQ